MIGKRGRAPCGHEGEHVIGSYVACRRCDLKACAGKPIEGGGHDFTIDRYDGATLVTAWRCTVCGLRVYL